MTPRAKSWIPPLTGLFPGAAASRTFLRGLQRQCAGLSDWRRATAWLPEVLAQRPRLSPIPLFGHNLAAAVQVEAERAETPAPLAAAANAPLPRGPGGAAVDRRRRASGVARERSPRFSSVPRQQSAPPVPTPTRVERSLLTSLAGGIPAAPQPSGRRFGPLFGQRAGSRHLPVGAGSGRLVQQLAQRLRAGLLAGKAGALPAAFGHGHPPTEKNLADLEGQWASVLRRTGVSRGFLEDVLPAARERSLLRPPAKAQPAPSAAFDPGPSGRGAGKAEPAPDSRRSGQSRPVAPAAGRVGPLARTTGEDIRLRHPRFVPGEAVPLPALLRPGSVSVTAAGATDGEPNPDRLDPGADGRRGEIPAGQGAHISIPMVQFAPLPDSQATLGERFFSALRQQYPPQPGDYDRKAAAIPDGSDEDLDDLTAKLQRILQEQARRHGIDV